MAGANTSVEYSDHNKNIQAESNAKQWAREIENKIECGNLGAIAKPTNETLGEVLEKSLHQITPQKKSSGETHSGAWPIGLRI